MLVQRLFLLRILTMILPLSWLEPRLLNQPVQSFGPATIMRHHVPSNREFTIRTPLGTFDGGICSAKDALVVPCQKMSLDSLAGMTATKAFSPGGDSQYNASSVTPHSRSL